MPGQAIRTVDMSTVYSSLDVRKQLELLSQMVEEISGELALEPLLGRIVERARRLLGADDGMIGLYSPEHDAIRTAATSGKPIQNVYAYVHPGEGLAGYVLETNAPVRIRYGDLPHPLDSECPDKIVLGMPIRLRGELVGVFCLGSWQADLLNEQAQDLLDLFARHAAIAIDNARRYSEEQRRSSRFELIANVAAMSASGPDLDTLLQRAADAIHEILDYPNVDIPLIDQDDPETLVIRIRGGEYKRRIKHEDRLPINVGIMGAAVRERRAQLVNDVTRDARYVVPPGVQPPGAELAIPILHGDNVLGVLNVEGERPFDELDRASLEIVAENLAVAIVNARLFERSTQVAVLEERQRLARDLHDNVTQILSSMSLITQSLTEAWHRDPAEGERRAARLGELSQLAFAELRGMLQELSPRARTIRASAEQDPPDTLPKALRRLLRAMVPAHVHLQFDVVDYRPQKQAHEEAMLRICQEAVSNAVRHAAPRRVEVSLSLTETDLYALIADDGRGMPENARRGMGLGNMRERLHELGGGLRISPRRPTGTHIKARLPRCDRETS